MFVKQGDPAQIEVPWLEAPEGHIQFTEDSTFLTVRTTDGIDLMNKRPGDDLIMGVDGGVATVYAMIDTTDLPPAEYVLELSFTAGDRSLYWRDTLITVDEYAFENQRQTRPWDFLNPNTEWADSAEAQYRMSVCGQCEKFTKLLKCCKECGCFLPAKTRLADSRCPIGRW